MYVVRFRCPVFRWRVSGKRGTAFRERNTRPTFSEPVRLAAGQGRVVVHGECPLGHCECGRWICPPLSDRNVCTATDTRGPARGPWRISDGADAGAELRRDLDRESVV